MHSISPPKPYFHLSLCENFHVESDWSSFKTFTNNENENAFIIWTRGEKNAFSTIKWVFFFHKKKKNQAPGGVGETEQISYLKEKSVQIFMCSFLQRIKCQEEKRKKKWKSCQQIAAIWHDHIRLRVLFLYNILIADNVVKILFSLCCCGTKTLFESQTRRIKYTSWKKRPEHTKNKDISTSSCTLVSRVIIEFSGMQPTTTWPECADNFFFFPSWFVSEPD